MNHDLNLIQIIEKLKNLNKSQLSFIKNEIDRIIHPNKLVLTDDEKDFIDKIFKQQEKG